MAADGASSALRSAFDAVAHGQPARVEAEQGEEVLLRAGLLPLVVRDESLELARQSLRLLGTSLGWETLLGLAAKLRKFQECAGLEVGERMKRFPRVHMPNSDGQTPLEQAVRAADADEAEQLLRFGALPDEPFFDGQTTPLFLACERGDEPMVRVLIGAKCDPSIGGGPMGALPLYIASYRGHTGVVAALLEGRVSPDM